MAELEQLGAEQGQRQYADARAADDEEGEGARGHDPTVTTPRNASAGAPGDTAGGGRVFLVPVSVVAESDEAVPVTPLDAAGRPLAGETLVPIAGRDPEG
ncbi:hypothetical protein GCM10010429_46270 [Micromonospora olivasterospora]